MYIEYYGTIRKEELEEIHTLRKFFIDNPLIKKVIGDFEIKDPIFTEAILELIQTTSKKGKNGDLEKKKTLLKNIFPEGIPVNEKKQVRTPAFSLIYQTLSIGERGTFELVEFLRTNLNTFENL